MTPSTAMDFRVSPELAPSLRNWRRASLGAGIGGALAMSLGMFVSPFQFYRSYLWAYLFVLGLSLGSMGWLMLQYLTGGAWGVVSRRAAEAGTRTLWLAAAMFLPIVIGIPNLYSWSHASVVAADKLLQQKHTYLNVPFFLVRAGIAFAGWLFLAWYFNRWSDREDRSATSEAHRKMSWLAGPGILFWCFSITFMTIDWVMSLNPHWYSTMFGLLFIAGEGLTGMAFLITVLVMLSKFRPMSEVLTPRQMHDLGKLMFCMVMVWAYFSFSQLLIIWAGNLPEEIPWYLERLAGGWQYVGLALIFGHFALPFALLLSRDLKRNFKLLASIAVFVLIMRLVDLYWLVVPDYRPGAFHVSWMDIAAPVALIGIWLAFFFSQLEKRPLMPLHDPNLEETLAHGR